MEEINYIGIGASAGGLNALQNLLSNIPVPSHSIYIIVQHLSSDRKSLLSEILAKYTDIDVLKAKEGSELLVGKVYIIPPNMTLSKNKNSKLTIINSDNTSAPQPSIDDVFTFLAHFSGAKSIGILLSGSGHDGVKGLKAISDVDGITLVQSPEEAEFKSMPQSAIDAKVAHESLSLHGIAKIIKELDSISDDETALEAIRILLINYNGFDIHKYKENTVLRRMHKRMLLLQIDTFKSYTRYVIKNHRELQLLYEDILIGVTSFFRDQEAFTILSKQVSNLIKKSKNKKELRIWVTACSTGEEAYSIAIIINELLNDFDKQISVNIFASDIDDISLKKARKGIYSESELKNMDSSIRSKYFIQKNNDFEVTQSLRDIIVFAHHDLLNEPPFIKMDLITCRNALIYFTHPTQKEIFTMFHYALNVHGILFLGISEALPQNMNYFTLLNSKWKIYEKEPSITPPKLAPRFYKMLSSAYAPENAMDTLKQSNASSLEKHLAESIYKLFIPSCVIVNQHDDMIYTKGKIPYLEFSDGFSSLNIFKNLHPSLRLEVRYTLEKSRKGMLKIISQFIELQDSLNKSIFVRITATPFSYQNTDALTLLYFQEYSINEIIFDAQRNNFPKKSDLVNSLQIQVSQMKEQLHALQNELDSSNENMQMINEELQSSNEELQSSNEELETSNEELQATNEELNETYHHIDSLQQQYSTILKSSLDGILGLDLEEKHTFVNSIALKMFDYKIEDLIGKVGHDIWHHTNADGTPSDKKKCSIRNVLKTGKNVRGEDIFWRRDGTSFEVEYTSSPIIENKKITGAVLFFHDISEKKALERAVKHEQFLIKHYFDSTQAIIVVLDKNGNIQLLNQKGADILGTNSKDIIGKNWFSNFINKSIQKEVQKLFDSVIKSDIDSITPYTNEIIAKNGEKYLIYWTSTPLVDENRKIIGVIATGINITKENELRTQLLEEEKKYTLIFNNANIGIKLIDLDGKFLNVNQRACEIVGYTKQELLSMKFHDITYSEDLNSELTYTEQLLKNKISFYEIQKRFIHKDGSKVWVNLFTSLIKDNYNQPKYFVSVIQDITVLKETTKALHEKEEMMISQSRQAAMGDMISMIAHQWRQPISIISMEVNNLQADLELNNKIENEELKHLSQTISLQTQHLSETIDDFRNFFKPNKEIQSTTINEIFNNVKNLIQKSLENNNILLEIDNNKNYQILTYKNELIQVLVNLILNAKDAIDEKHTSNGKIYIKVTKKKNEIFIKVCDNGIGIPKKLLHKLGEPYISSKGKNGTGLGLYMSSVIVTKHLQGSLTWKNTSNGACFNIILPLKVSKK